MPESPVSDPSSTPPRVDTAEELPEIPLLGGDVTEGVVRVGDTVRRPLGEHSPAVHAYLRHLERAGFDAAPRFLGVDDRGREVVSWIDGEMAGRPLQPWAGDEDVLVAIARLQRRLHDASEGFALPEGVHWRLPVVLEGVPTAYDEPDVIGHNDLTPENLIFVDRRPVGIVDFDLAGPTTRALDVVTALLWWAPLREPVDRDPVLRDLDSAPRIRTYVDAYGLDDGRRSGLLDVADRRYRRSWHVMHHHAVHLGGGWARMWDEGVGDQIRRGHEWLQRERPRLEAALAD